MNFITKKEPKFQQLELLFDRPSPLPQPTAQTAVFSTDPFRDPTAITLGIDPNSTTLPIDAGMLAPGGYFEIVPDD